LSNIFNKTGSLSILESQNYNSYNSYNNEQKIKDKDKIKNDDKKREVRRKLGDKGEFDKSKNENIENDISKDIK
jgi:hypothetical protein